MTALEDLSTLLSSLPGYALLTDGIDRSCGSPELDVDAADHVADVGQHE